MRAGQSFIQIVLGAAADNLLLMLQIIIEHLLEVEHSGLAVNQRQHYGAECFLELGVFIEIVEHYRRIDVLFQLHDYAHAVLVGFIP